MSRRETVKAAAKMIGYTVPEFIRDVVIIHHFSNEQDVIDQLVQRYDEGGPLPDYLIFAAEYRLGRPQMSENAVA